MKINGWPELSSDDGELLPMTGIHNGISGPAGHENGSMTSYGLITSLNQVKRVAMRAQSREELFDGICRVLVESGPFRMAWVGLLDVETQTVTPVAQYGDDYDYLQNIRITAVDEPSGSGPTGISIRERHSYICNDFYNDPHTLLWREQAERSGFKSSAAFPLYLSGAVCGALTIYALQKDFFGASEISLLDEAAWDVSYVLDNIEGERWRKRNEDKLARITQEQKTILETAPIGILKIIDRKLVWINSKLEKMLLYGKDELLLETTRKFYPSSDAYEKFDSEAYPLLAQGEQYETEQTLIRKDGTPITVKYVGKAIDPTDMSQGTIWTLEDITEQKATQAQIQQLAYFDTLTDLPNRRLLNDRLAHAHAQAKRFNRSMAVMFLDLDNFKHVNDTLGHDVGDELLKVVAERLLTCVRTSDLVCRQGGDEFVIILSEISNPDDATIVAEKIIKSIKEPIMIQDHTLQVTTSIGIAVYPVNGIDDARELMKQADLAMYETKSRGRDGFSIYNP